MYKIEKQKKHITKVSPLKVNLKKYCTKNNVINKIKTSVKF